MGKREGRGRQRTLEGAVMLRTEEQDVVVDPQVAREHRTTGSIPQSAEDGKEGTGQSMKDLTIEMGWMTIQGQSF